MTSSIFSSKVLWGIVLTFVVGGLTALGTVNPAWGGTITAIVALLTAIGHSTNLTGAKGV
jgi:hypothetical protein